MTDGPSIDDVRGFWEKNPVCARDISYPQGSKEYFEEFDRLRARGERPWVDRLYDFGGACNLRVLDVGCGNGYVLSRYSAAGAVTTGVDITRAGVDLSRKRFHLTGLKGDFLVADAESLPFPDDTFDRVTSMGVLHHTLDTEKAVQQIYRVLKPGGRFLIMLYHRDSVLYRFKFPLLSRLTGKSRQQLVNEVDGAENPKGAVYSRDEMRHLLAKFELKEMITGALQGWMLFPLIGKWIPDFLLLPFEKLGGWFLYAVAYKPAHD